MQNLKARKEYFAVKNNAYASPKGVYNTLMVSPDSIILIDVRNPVAEIPSRITGSVWIPEQDIKDRMTELSKDKLIVLYCWDTWCSLATSAAIPLLDAGYDVKELNGGIKAWRTLRQPVDDLTKLSQ